MTPTPTVFGWDTLTGPDPGTFDTLDGPDPGTFDTLGGPDPGRGFRVAGAAG